MAFAVFGFSVPVFVVGYLLAYVFALELEWLPVQGYTPIVAGSVAVVRKPDPAGDCARLRLHRADRAHHPRRDAGSAAAGLYPHRARQGHRAARHPVRPRAEERRGADRHGDRHRRRAA